MPSLSSTLLSTACLIGIVLAAPTAPLLHGSPRSSCTAPGNITMPVTYNLYPGDPDRAEAPTSYIDIQNLPDREEREQVIVFQGVPAGALTCTLGWVQAAAAEREFVVEDNGSTKVKPFYDFPSATTRGLEEGDGDCNEEEQDPVINYSTIKPLSSASAELELGPDFTFWNDSPGAVPHVAGAVPCAEEMYFHIRINPGNGLGDVHFRQDEKNGFIMNWVCEA
ncbi:hypothetical protein Micbo1qcDRAFT_200055 [Microdochium bolleyi]|uniref:Ubiquitin 3 binding protein But2 C-terminal domain-containing protein n=1 Tax=Microdochium bolleyi TaxID=196109 RepID=A0A136JJL2_9PEZI|nr:hypothetical protein Micbo1qcDRAFT_200055 [Microdochium bolleyi]